LLHVFSAQSLHSVFFEAYDYRAFLIALGFSLVGLVIMAALENLLLRPLLKGMFPSYFDYKGARAIAPPQKLQMAGHSVGPGNGTSAYAGGAYPSAPKLSDV
jgi:hypothetical protein